MSVPLFSLPSASSAPLSPAIGEGRKKRVLLLDTSQTKRDLRAEVMRKLGIEVDCAADVLEARSWWRADLYNLVLINQSGEAGSRDEFCVDMRKATPPQRIAFFVGGPDYLAASPQSGADPAADAGALQKEMVAVLLAQAAREGSQRWGILEACKRISSVRSVSEARSRALREAPRPSRWADAIEQHSTEATRTLPTTPAAVATQAIATDAVANEALANEREGLL